MGVKWDVLNKQADDARLARQEREKRAKEAKAAEEERERRAQEARAAEQERGRRAQEAIAQGARPESQKRRAFTMLIDEVVDAGVRRGLNAHNMRLVRQWAVDLMTQLGLNEGQAVHSALFDLNGETTAIISISSLKNAIEYGGRVYYELLSSLYSRSDILCRNRIALLTAEPSFPADSNLPTWSNSWRERSSVRSQSDTPWATPRGSTVVTLESWASKLAVKPTLEVTGSSETGSKV